jgi:multicomponent Na+:H+ antiporter subunit C
MNAIFGYAPHAVALWVLACGLYGIVTSKHLVHLVLCVAIAQTSTYVLLAGIGYQHGSAAPVTVDVPRDTPLVDAVVQSLLLTDVVVEATVVALLLAIVVQAYEKSGMLDPSKLRNMRG